MRTLKKNKQGMHYAVLVGEEPVYKLDGSGNKIVDYVDEDGNEYYRKTGNMELVYSNPKFFKGNIAMSGGDSKSTEYGIDVSDYDAVLVLDKDALEITETSLIWHKSEIGYKDTDRKIPDPNTADYKVKKVVPSLNFDKYLLKRIVK